MAQALIYPLQSSAENAPESVERPPNMRQRAATLFSFVYIPGLSSFQTKSRTLGDVYFEIGCYPHFESN
jgi:hypothetical protein